MTGAAERRAIRKLVEKGPCTSADHCADYILQGWAGLPVHLRLCRSGGADRRLCDESEKGPAKRLEEKVKMRRTHYKYNTGQEWGCCQTTICHWTAAPWRWIAAWICPTD
ncbi:hypothetical protein [Bittarella massiliensis (ex Durand et al. 2017)]|uniref:hypothetical protein n=1 Tax=Bittarella massiliensis (ex Durand et al. 2017) TaxID=1720313 RepID=UPI001AA189CE|nr:hypothetical protein [Bittarella massiliensis (ex Durand et al. 2017)]MBO1680119.1 hypothetical protein [Bittarella massiliensis (ex Durand et al. 2017)]